MLWLTDYWTHVEMPVPIISHVSRTRKSVILGHNVKLEKGLKFAQYHEGHTVTCVYMHSSR